ncbi:NAD(+) synthase [Microgenomates group bacterium]|nr:NAD(+) synthase [Microgenomates group bacterium]
MQQEIERIIREGREVFAREGFERAVVGVSGGVDSAVALFLSVRILRADKVWAVTMPDNGQNPEDALLVMGAAGIEENNQIISPIGHEIDIIADAAATDSREQTISALRRGNIAARLRMIHLWDLAVAREALVVGTANKSEVELGYYTLWGDMASSIELFSHLYKTQVFGLAKELGVPDKIIEKAPSADLWEGQTDEGELGASYEVIDRVLQGRLEGIDEELARKIQDRVESQGFKRKLPYII